MASFLCDLLEPVSVVCTFVDMPYPTNITELVGSHLIEIVAFEAPDENFHERTRTPRASSVTGSEGRLAAHLCIVRVLEGEHKGELYEDQSRAICDYQVGQRFIVTVTAGQPRAVFTAT